MATCTVVPFAHVDGVCDRCGKKLVGRQARWCSRRCSLAYRREHRWSLARVAARRRDKYQCTSCGWRRVDGAVLEVNHIEPRRGKGYGWGCHNHLANLETLCHNCHLVVTRKQREEARDERRPVKRRAA